MCCVGGAATGSQLNNSCKKALPTSKVFGMNTTLFKALIGLVPAGTLLTGSVVVFFKEKTTWSLLEMVGAGCLMLVVLAHIAEALDLFPSMGFGLEHSIGHFIDLWSAIFGLALFPVGYSFHALAKQCH
jgi:hypothetical protein